jgi:sugar phosphate isomerase/epimerase
MERNEIGLVLYTVRDRAEKDFAGTVREVAGIGYGCVEICGTFGLAATQVRELGGETGLRLLSAHVGLGDLTDGFDKTADYYGEAGVEMLVVPGLPEECRGDTKTWVKTARLLSEIGARLKDRGVPFGFHNHDVEFKPVGGTTGWDILVRECDPGCVNFQVDVYWAATGGRDPLDALEAVRGRVPTIHAKDMAPGGSMADVGAGTLDFAAMAAARAELGIRCFLVEHDEPAPSSIESARKSFDFLRTAIA